jgi:hypothetical protein
MSKPGIIYRGSFMNTQADYLTNEPDQQTVYVDIYDTETLIDDDDDEQVINLELSDFPVKISVIDNDEDKYTPIRAKQATIIIHSSSAIDISTFAAGGDNRWKVQIYLNVDTNTLFWGFLSISDMQMEFQPNPNELVLTASDNLGLLKDIALTDFDGNTPRGKNKMIEFISWCLYKTGLSLPIYVVNNIREEDYPDDHLYDVVYLETKTFEEEIGECEDCYSVLEKILGESCYLTQWKGRWFILNIDELDTNEYYQSHFDYEGTFVEHLDPVNFYKEIGFQYDPSEEVGYELSWFGLPDTPPVVSFERAYKHIKETYNYEYPKEIIDNIDFARGTDWLSVFNLGTLAAAYTIEDWTLQRQTGVNEIDAYIKKTYQDVNWTYVVESYVVLTDGATAQHWIISNPVELHESDKFSFSVDWRLSANQSGSGTITETVAQLRLYGNDGTFWTCTSEAQTGEAVGEWIECNSAFTSNQRFVKLIYTNDQVNEAEEWQTVSVDTKPLPVDGEVRVLLLNSSIHGTDMETHFSNMVFTYHPYINGAYSVYRGQYNKVSQELNTRQVRDEEVFISDSPKKLFKGAMFKLEGSDYVLCERFYAANVFPDGVPDDGFYHPYGYLQAFSVWNQYNRAMVKLEGKIDGLQTQLTDGGLPGGPDLPFKFFMMDITPYTTDGVEFFKYFMCLHFEQDFNLCEWDGFFYEVYDTARGKVYDDDFEFKYISGS